MRRAVLTALVAGMMLCAANAARASTWLVSNSGQFTQGSLPTGAQCASWIRSDGWEPRPENAFANSWSAAPSAAELAAFHANPLNFQSGPPASDFANVDGNYAGTTWQIIEWAACKWGVNAYDLAAEAWAESEWHQTTLGDQQWNYAACTGGPWIGWEPWGGCWTSFGIIQEKASGFNTMPMAATSTAFNLDFRAAFWRACIDGDEQYLYNETPAAGYPTYANATGYQRYWGCMGEWYSGGWDDPGSVSYQTTVQGFSASRPWLNLPNSQVGQIAITSPQRGQTVSGTVQISFVMPDGGDPLACYACVAVDGGSLGCGNNLTYSWNSASAGVDGPHEITVDTASCPSNGQDQEGYHAGIWVTTANGEGMTE